MSPNGQDRVRCFLDRIDYSTPTAPSRDPKLNIPGSLIGVDWDSEHVVIVDYERQTAMIDDEEYRFRCQKPSPFGTAFELDLLPNAAEPVPCVRIDWSVKVVDVSGATNPAAPTKILDVPVFAPTHWNVGLALDSEYAVLLTGSFG